jgi:integrase
MIESGNLPPNPFARAALTELARLHDFDDRFRAWVGGPRNTLATSMGELLVSAILYGGLASPRCWQPWLNILVTTSPLSKSTMVPIKIPSVHSTTKLLSRNWFADPVTAALILRWLPGHKKEDRSARPLAVDLLLGINRELGFPAETQKQFLGWFVPAVALRLRLQIPPVLAEHALAYGKSQPVWLIKWNNLKKLDDPRAFAEKHQASFVAALPPASDYQTASSFKLWDPKITDQRIWVLWSKINNHIGEHGSLGGSSGIRNRNARAVRNAMIEVFEGTPPARPFSVREAVIGFFYRLASSQPAEANPRLGTRTINTLNNYLGIFGRANWQPYYSLRLAIVEGVGLHPLYAEILEAASEGDRDTAVSAISAFDKYVGHSWPQLTRWKSPYAAGQSSPLLQLISSAQFKCTLALLDYHPGGPRDALMCRLTATLMFRAGLRAQEARFLRIGDIDHADDLVELVVRTNLDAAAKTRGSYRRLPLDVLLDKAELDELLRWRARRIVELHGNLAGRLFDDEVAQPLGLSQNRLLVPIEQALATAENPKNKSRVTPKWVLGGALRHSFASYLLATCLLPDDVGPLPLPSGIDADCVSAARKKRVSARLLGDSRLGQSAVHAVSLLMGHAHVSRLLDTYMHLLDWSLGVQLRRWSLQPGFDVQVVRRILCKSGGICPLPADGSLPQVGHCTTAEDCTRAGYAIRKTTQRRMAVEQAFLAGLMEKPNVAPVTRSIAGPENDTDVGFRAGSRVIRPRGPRPADAPLLGNAFVDHGCDQTFTKHPVTPRAGVEAVPTLLRALKPIAVGRQIDAVLALARRGLGKKEIAAILCIDVGLCQRWLERARKISTITRGAKSRHTLFDKRLSFLTASVTGGDRSSVRRLKPLTNGSEHLVLAQIEGAFKLIDEEPSLRKSLGVYLGRVRAGGVTFRSPDRAAAFADDLHRLGISADLIRHTVGPSRVLLGPSGPGKSATDLRDAVNYGLLVLAVASERLNISHLCPSPTSGRISVAVEQRQRLKLEANETSPHKRNNNRSSVYRRVPRQLERDNPVQL